ncbi:hypothetical protein PAXRUDRAFT_35885 [Paxillus rubicundulus Ve08.2h10]|uniref:Uncharacterized protein n=1 Tax=Paxillus rubicundulus Ve08.2h10 TaxID=930991 RepID=A0A0D0DIJ6_9AGAM|nr:hypothetical protein PAXRUDRAFT_35885 [Paxillus rubicundulus Ve08.2h10]
MTDAWRACLPKDIDDEVLCHCVVVVEKMEVKKQEEENCKAIDKQAIEDAKKLGKDALSSALHLLIKQKLTDHDIHLVDKLICEYGVKLIKLYGSVVLMPNHHYTTYVGDCAHNFGPLHDFGTFLYEHLNKVLKSFKTNNHWNGDLETMFFKEFQRTFTNMLSKTYILCIYPPKSLPSQTAHVMLKESDEEHGTIAGLGALSQEFDNVSTDRK